jgi:signal transduction histidine kinase
MPDYYHVPALVLLTLLLPAFGYMYLRFRDARTLLWLLGFFLSLVSMILLYAAGEWGVGVPQYSWLGVIGQVCVQIAPALFLGSLSPMGFRVGRFHVLYVIPFTLPLVVGSVLLYGVFHGVSPGGAMFVAFPALCAITLGVGLLWSAQKEGGSIPTWLSVAVSVLLGDLGYTVYVIYGAAWALTFIACASLQAAALLVIFVFRRVSPGVLLSVLGLVAWSLSILEIFPGIGLNPVIDLNLIHIIVMGKVVAALGMILLALEDELNINKAAGERERRARRELEAYTNLILTRRRVEDFDRQGTDICKVVVAHSRFAQAALMLEIAGQYRLAGAAGLEAATELALGELVARIPPAYFLMPGSAPSALEQSQTLRLDFSPWLKPGDDLTRLQFTSVLAVPMVGQSGTEGAFLLSGIRPAHTGSPAQSPESLRADELLPIETLAARLQATRSQTMMLEKLIDAEKFVGLGQLAGSVTQQLNNPLTVILGYASLLEEEPALDARERKGVESILSEARRMRSTLESLSRVARSHGDQLAAVSVSELLADMEELHRPEFLQRSIEFRLSIAPELPRVLCSAQQLRQAVLHCLKYAIAAVENQADQGEPKTIRLEATSEGNLVQILVAHTGPGFPNPASAFDPFVSAQADRETAGLGLSLCATILRDNNGRASAVNLEPRGAAIILELRAA